MTELIELINQYESGLLTHIEFWAKVLELSNKEYTNANKED